MTDYGTIGLFAGIAPAARSRNFRSDVVPDAVRHAVGIGKKRAEGLVEALDNSAELRFHFHSRYYSALAV